MTRAFPFSLQPDELVIDNFAGGGGASTGIEAAIGRPIDVAINHDAEAIAMHLANHPRTLHLTEDVWKVDVAKVVAGRKVGLAWFSPDCKHFSKAKGGKPVEKKIRGLAWVVLRWVGALKPTGQHPRVICLENVEEFVTWGPLTQDGRPCPRNKGREFRAFVNALQFNGYAVQWRELRACDYGAPTSRKRLFLVARRDGLWALDTASGETTPLAPPPYDPARQRYNDGKPDAAGRFWVGALSDAREPEAALYRIDAAGAEPQWGGIVTSNGLAWSPDGRWLYRSDTKAHTIWRHAFDIERGALAEEQVFARFTPRAADQPLSAYGGRPDGAAVDEAGAYWVAMFEGARLLRYAASGALLQEVVLPVRCPTMPCFGGPDRRTLFVTTASDKRPADELAREPWAGAVLALRVDVPGLPANLCRL